VDGSAGRGGSRLSVSRHTETATFASTGEAYLTS